MLRPSILVFLTAFPLLAQFAPNRYTLLLQDPPVAARFATRAEMDSAAGRAYRTQIEARQQNVLNELANRRIPVTGSTSVLINAIFVTAPPSRVQEMLSIPGVTGVRPMRRLKLFLNAATTLMNAPAAWNLVGGQTNAGKGLMIGVLDTGIDQTHPAFQDSTLSTPTGFPICDTYNQPLCSNYTNNKVIVARSYVRQIAMENVTNSSNPAPQSMPDDYTPRDRMGHGTAVASAAAGNITTGAAVAAAGGPLTFSGMAPKAYLGNYKIAGSPGVNDGGDEQIMIQALTDALSDGMDIVTTSSGFIPATSGALDTSCGGPCDPVGYAFEMAAEKGMLITVAAGNQNGDQYGLYQNYPYLNSISSPATAPSVIGVGATLNSHALTPSVSVNVSGAPSNLEGIAADPSYPSTFSPSLQGADIGPLIDITQLGNDGYACSPLSGSLNGAYALIERGPSSNPCAFATKVTNAQAAGASGVIFYNYDSSAIFPPDISEATFVGPVVLISNSDGENLKTYIDANSGASVTIDSAGIETPLTTYDSQLGLSPALAANQLASYSSFGPAPDGTIKPDMVATGGLDPGNAGSLSSGMYMAGQNFDTNGDLYTENRFVAADGTSFATPLVAGAAALVKQLHPSYTAAQIKSALLNTSAQDTTTDDGSIDINGNQDPPQPVNVEWLGAGRLDAGAAAGASVTVTPSTVSFGYLQTSTSLPITKSLTVTNLGGAAVTLTVAVVASAAPANASVTVAPTSLAIAAGASATLSVTLSGSVPSAGAYTGQVTLQATSVSLVVPFMYLVGSGVAYNAIPYIGGEGTPGEDIGVNIVQVVDTYGVPVAGEPVTFSAPASSMTFNSVSGSPACTGSGSNSVVCNTDNYGFAWADVVLGSSAGSPSITAGPKGLLSQPTPVLILPVPTISTGTANCYGVPASQGDVCNAASFQSSVSPGSYVSIFGSNLVDAGEVVNPTGDLASASPYFPLVLDGVNVSFDVPSAGISVPAPIVFVSSGQINVLVPWELQGQTSAQVKVIVDEVIYGNVVTAALASYTPAFFTSCGNNFACAQDLKYNLITSSNPAVPGQIIQLYANGLGPVYNQPADGYPAPLNANQTTTQPCSVSIGGQPATVQFCGLAPGEVIYQVNVVVPMGLSSGNQPITVSVGGQTSPSGVMIPVE
jgi:minor extracellular serine protease Vpr